MISTIKRPIFAHDLINPPSEDRNCDVSLILINSKGRINLVKEGVGILQTRYMLSIADPLSLGLLNSEQNTIELFIKDLVLACNLVLRHAVLSKLEGDLTQSNIEFKQPEAKVIEENTPQGKHITITEVLTLGESIHLTVGLNEEIDEGKMISNLALVNKVNRNKLSAHGKAQLVNLGKSLSEYESAMLSFDRLIIFKHLFNSLELATNWDGTDRKGSCLDTEVANVTGIQMSEVCDWREFYNRTKHIDRTPKDITAFVKGTENLPQKLMTLRFASEIAIIDRLKKL